MEKGEDRVTVNEEEEPAGPWEPGYVVVPVTVTRALGKTRPSVSACPTALAGPAWHTGRDEHGRVTPDRAQTEISTSS